MSSIREALEGMQFNSEIEEGWMVADALIVARLVHAENGETSVFLSATDGSDVVTMLGLIEAARQIQAGEWGDIGA